MCAHPEGWPARCRPWGLLPSALTLQGLPASQSVRPGKGPPSLGQVPTREQRCTQAGRHPEGTAKNTRSRNLQRAPERCAQELGNSHPSKDKNFQYLRAKIHPGTDFGRRENTKNVEGPPFCVDEPIFISWSFQAGKGTTWGCEVHRYRCWKGKWPPGELQMMGLLDQRIRGPLLAGPEASGRWLGAVTQETSSQGRTQWAGRMQALLSDGGDRSKGREGGRALTTDGVKLPRRPRSSVVSV